MKKPFVFDTETTGLVKNRLLPLDQQPRVIVFYGEVINSKGTCEDRIHFLSNPGFSLEPVITKITGLTDVDLRSEPPFKESIDGLVKILESVDAIAAHNIKFDKTMLEIEFEHAQMDLPWPTRSICTIEASEHYKGHRLNLTKLHEYLFDEIFTDAHRAKTDVAALVRCFNEMVNRGDI